MRYRGTAKQAKEAKEVRCSEMQDRRVGTPEPLPTLHKSSWSDLGTEDLPLRQDVAREPRRSLVACAKVVTSSVVGPVCACAKAASLATHPLFASEWVDCARVGSPSVPRSTE